MPVRMLALLGTPVTVSTALGGETDAVLRHLIGATGLRRHGLGSGHGDLIGEVAGRVRLRACPSGEGGIRCA